jgi:hypothetical protein
MLFQQPYRFTRVDLLGGGSKIDTAPPSRLIANFRGASELRRTLT